MILDNAEIQEQLKKGGHFVNDNIGLVWNIWIAQTE